MDKDIPVREERDRTGSVAPLQLINREAVPEFGRAPISWRAIFAGVFLSLLFYLVLMTLGVAIGSSVLPGVIRGEAGGSGLGIGSAIWTVVALVASIFFGAYFAGRVSGLRPIRTGGTQGLVTAALFFAVMFTGVSSTIGSLGRGVGSLVSSAGSLSSDLAQNPEIQASVEDALGGLNLKSPPADVARGVARRLLRGNEEGAKAYLASQAGITQAEADRRLESFKQQFDNTVKDVGASIAKATAVGAWTLFGALLIGSLLGWLGGVVGMRANLSDPLSERDLELFRRSKAA